MRMKQFFYLLKLLNPLIEDALTFFFFGEAQQARVEKARSLVNF